MGKNEDLLKTSFDGKRYNQIKEFMINIWESKAKYKVFMARRAFNLNYAFMEACDVQREDGYFIENIMSNTAFLLCAEKLAEYYRQFRQFPRVLIVDDLLFHGRGIIKLLDNFERLIIEFLDQKGIDAEEAILHEKLFLAVNIYVFAQNKDGLLIDRHYALKSERFMEMNELRGLSQQISNALQGCGVANTSYVLSTVLPTDFSGKSNDNSDSKSSHLFRYRGYSQLYYYKYSMNLLKTVRASISAKTLRSCNLFTSLVIFSDILSEDFHKLCDDVAGQLDAVIPCSRIAEILRYKNAKLVRPKAQMLSFLLSIECFVEFYREKISTDGSALYSTLLKSDYRKIVTNFDKVSMLRYEVIELFKYISFSNVSEYVVSDTVGKYAPEIRGMPEYGALTGFEAGYVADTMENALLCETAEDIFYEVGINAECDAVSYIHKRKKFESDSPGSDIIQLNQYLSIMDRKTDTVKSIGCIFQLMDSGLLSMNMEQNQQRLQCVLKSGELSMYVLPRRFSVFIRALAIVERSAQKREDDVRVAISRFIDYLQNYCYEKDACGESEDQELLTKLKKSKGILLYMYESGQHFQDWDTELLTEGDRIANIEAQYGRYRPGQYQMELWDENHKKNYYAFCARAFVRSDKW